MKSIVNIGLKMWLATWLLVCLPSIAQTSPNLVLTSIEFEGNKKTKEDYLQKLLLCKEGDALNPKNLQKDLLRLRSLNAFANVQHQLDTLENGAANLTFVCEEVQTLLPIIGLGFLPGNEWFKIGALDVNTLGWGIESSFFYQFNRRHSFNFNLKVPNIGGSSWGINTNLLWWESEEPLYFEEAESRYFYRNRSALLTVSYDINNWHQIELGGSLFEEQYKKLNEMDFGPSGLDVFKQLIKLNYHFQKLDYFYHYRSGWANTASFQIVFSKLGYVPEETEPFEIFTNDLRYYKRIGKMGNFASRLVFGISANNRSPFAAFVVDGHQNIRGVGNRIARATAIASLNLEYRHTFKENKTWALQGVVFTDEAVWREPGQMWGKTLDGENEAYRMYVGGGIRFIHQKIFGAIVRLDFGLNIRDAGENGFVLGLGQYF